MRIAIAAATFGMAIDAVALVSRDGNWYGSNYVRGEQHKVHPCFGITSNGGPGGPIGQLSDGQLRSGQGLPPSTFCIDTNGGLTDQNGRGCILTPPTTQFQCDAGVTPYSGFSISCDGTITYNGNATFIACPTGDHGGYNIYTQPLANQQGCVEVTLIADNCKPGCPSPSPSPTPTPTALPSPSPSTPKCPAELTGNWEFPHLIVPIDSSQPDTALGTTYHGTVTSTIRSLFNFDIPSSDAGKTCSLIFTLPTQDQLETSKFSLSGSGSIRFALLDSAASGSTTNNNAPGGKTEYGATTLVPGNSYTIASFPCPAGQVITFGMQSSEFDTQNPTNPTNFQWFQDYNPCPIGLYITVQ